MYMDKKSKQFLFDYLNNASPTGFESSGQQIWLDYLKPYIDSHIVDVYGSVVGVINPKANYKVVIEAHADEIFWPGYDDVFIDDDIDQVGLQGIQRGQDDRQQGTEKQEFAVGHSQHEKALEQSPVEGLLFGSCRLTQCGRVI